MNAERYIRNLTGKKYGFPGAMPVSIDFNKKYDWEKYLMTHKFDGERFLIFACNGNSYKMNRKCQVTLLGFSIPDGIILDTEFYKDVYYIIDFIAENYKLKAMPFWKRIDQAKRLILNPKILPKVFFPVKKTFLLYEGFIFVHKNLKNIFKTTDQILKWKPFDLNTVDFLFQDNILKIQGEKGYIDIQNFSSDKLKDGDIVECSPYILNDVINWQFYRIRKDKTKPNYYTVYNNTVKSIKNFRDMSEILEK